MYCKLYDYFKYMYYNKNTNINTSGNTIKQTCGMDWPANMAQLFCFQHKFGSFGTKKANT